MQLKLKRTWCHFSLSRGAVMSDKGEFYATLCCSMCLALWAWHGGGGFYELRMTLV